MNGTELVEVIGGAAALVTGFWHIAIYIGALSVRVKEHTMRLDKHDERIDDHDSELRFLKGIR